MCGASLPAPCRFVTLFAVHGRAFAAWPMLIYTVYMVAIVLLMQEYMGAYIKDSTNAKIFQGLQAALSLVGVALFFLQVQPRVMVLGWGGWDVTGRGCCVGEGGSAGSRGRCRPFGWAACHAGHLDGQHAMQTCLPVGVLRSLSCRWF